MSFCTFEILYRVLRNENGYPVLGQVSPHPPCGLGDKIKITTPQRSQDVSEGELIVKDGIEQYLNEAHEPLCNKGIRIPSLTLKIVHYRLLILDTFLYTTPGVSIKFEVSSWSEKYNRLYEQGAVRNLSLIT